jgi:hypothetical protein
MILLCGHLNVCLTLLVSELQQLLLSACNLISFQYIFLTFLVSLHTYPYYVGSISMKMKEDSKGKAVIKNICYIQKDPTIKYTVYTMVVQM